MSGYDHMFPNLPGYKPRPLPAASAGQPLQTRIMEAVVGMQVGFSPNRHRITAQEALGIAAAVMDLLDEVAGEESAAGMVDATEGDRDV